MTHNPILEIMPAEAKELDAAALEYRMVKIIICQAGVRRKKTNLELIQVCIAYAYTKLYNIYIENGPKDFG